MTPLDKVSIPQLHSPLSPTFPHLNYNTNLYHTKGDYPPICFTQVDNLWITHVVQIGCICRCINVYQYVSIRRRDSPTKGRACRFVGTSRPVLRRCTGQTSCPCSVSLFWRRITKTGQKALVFQAGM